MYFVNLVKNINMNIKKFVALYLPIILCYARIQINVTVASNKKEVGIFYQGNDFKLITDEEINLFNVTDDNLKNGIRVELGKVPNDVYLHDPTPYDNLYETYKWTEVKRKLRVGNARIVDMINNNVVLKMSNHINNTTSPIKSNVALFESVENTMFSSWSEKGLPNDNIKYDIKINFHNNNNFKYENNWRSNTMRSVFISFGVKKDGYIEIKSGQTVTKKLTAVKIIMLIEIEYLATLTGSVVANYAHVYGKYHFWAPSIENIMRAAQLKNEVKTSELIEIRCYTDPKLLIFDTFTGKKLKIVSPIRPFRFLNLHKN